MKKRPALNYPAYLLFTCFALFPQISLKAADITWGTPTTVTSTNDISLNGTIAHAGSWGTTNLTVDVGGVETILFEDRPINTTDGKAGVNCQWRI